MTAAQDKADQIVGKLGLKPVEYEPAVYQCRGGCQDTGVRRMEAGPWDVGGTRGSTDWRGGKQRVVMTTATPEHPVYVRCRECNPVKPKDEKTRRTGRAE